MRSNLANQKGQQIISAIQNLINSGSDLDKDTVVSYLNPDFLNTSLYPILKHLFNAEAIQALENKADSLIYQYNIFSGPKNFENFYKVVFLMNKLNMWVGFSGDFGYYRKIDLVHFIAIKSSETNIHLTVNKIIDSINSLASMGFMRACMYPLGTFRISSIDANGKQKFVVFSYITLNDAGSLYVKANMPKMFIEENGEPNDIEDLL